jgi:hypothetical protein
MAEPQFPDPVKLFVAALWADAAALAEAVRRLEEHWGPCDFTGPDHPFDRTDYYASEMGPDLRRRLLAFEKLLPPEDLVEGKLFCNDVEEVLRGESGRVVNLDVGYLDHNKIVLASAKPAGQKIHLGRGIHADLVGRYAGGRYEPFPWTFPDFRDGRYDAELAELRRRYLEQLRALRRAAESA